jgi:hypothetical protein
VWRIYCEVRRRSSASRYQKEPYLAITCVEADGRASSTVNGATTASEDRAPRCVHDPLCPLCSKPTPDDFQYIERRLQRGASCFDVFNTYYAPVHSNRVDRPKDDRVMGLRVDAANASFRALLPMFLERGLGAVACDEHHRAVPGGAEHVAAEAEWSRLQVKLRRARGALIARQQQQQQWGRHASAATSSLTCCPTRHATSQPLAAAAAARRS